MFLYIVEHNKNGMQWSQIYTSDKSADGWVFLRLKSSLYLMSKYEGFIMDRLFLCDTDKFDKIEILQSTDQYQFDADIVLTKSSF